MLHMVVLMPLFGCRGLGSVMLILNFGSEISDEGHLHNNTETCWMTKLLILSAVVIALASS